VTSATSTFLISTVPILPNAEAAWPDDSLTAKHGYTRKIADRTGSNMLAWAKDQMDIEQKTLVLKVFMSHLEFELSIGRAFGGLIFQIW